MHGPAGRGGGSSRDDEFTDPADDHSQQVMQTYMVGSFLAVNAIRDAYALVEGPDCIHMKTQFVQGNHDWLSTLTSVSGVHRLANTALHPVEMTASREQNIRDFLDRMAAHEAVNAVLFTSMPMATITGADYDGICRAVWEASGKPVIHAKGNSLSRDWLDGYAEVLVALARQLPISGGTLDPNKVAIVGNLFDRHEGDHRGNVRELRRLIEGLGLEVASIWLDGGNFEDLLGIRDAGTIISLPYGRIAARFASRRTKATLIEADLPFGLPATERFVRAIAEATGREAEADALIDRELGEVVPPLEFVIPFVFQNRTWGFVGDPHLAQGMREIAQLLGSRLGFAIITDPAYHTKVLDEAFRAEVDLEIYPQQRRFGQVLNLWTNKHKAHVVISNGMAGFPSQCAVVEFGFPSPYTHCLYDRPFLGFRGFLAFVDTVGNAMRRHELEVALEYQREGGARQDERAEKREAAAAAEAEAAETAEAGEGASRPGAAA